MAKQHGVGVFCGAFDPFTLDDLSVAMSALDSGYLDQLLVVPASGSCSPVFSAYDEDRWKMSVAACAYESRLVSCRPESVFPPDVYSPGTLSVLKKEYPESTPYFVVTPESLPDLLSSSGFRTICRSCAVLLCTGSGKRDPQRTRAEEALDSLSVCVRTVPVRSLPERCAELHFDALPSSFPGRMDIPVREFCMCKELYGLSGISGPAGTWIDALFRDLKPKRFAHTLSVAFTARHLSVIHGLDSVRAEKAGLLHDCAKCLPLKEMQYIAENCSLTDDRTILESGSLLHSLVGAQVAEDRYNMKDPEVLDAIRFHNTGMPGMSRLAMCVCLADSIEPLRRDYPMLGVIRSLSLVSLERALLLSLERTADYVLSNGAYLHPRTRDTISWLKTLPEVSE